MAGHNSSLLIKDKSLDFILALVLALVIVALLKLCFIKKIKLQRWFGFYRYFPFLKIDQLVIRKISFLIIIFSIFSVTNIAQAQNNTMNDLGQSLGDVLVVSNDGSIISGFGKYNDSIYNDPISAGIVNNYSINPVLISADGSTVVGSYSDSDGYLRAFRYNGSDLIDLKTPGFFNSTAKAISADGGVVVGNSFNNDGADNHAFKYSGSTMIDLETLGGPVSYATAVSADGSVVVGYSFDSNGNVRPFKYTSSIIDLVGLPNDSNPYAISADGNIIAGDYTDFNGLSRGFKYIGSTMIDLGTLSSSNSNNFVHVDAISADGSVVVGRATNPEGKDNAFKYTNTNLMVNLGTLGGDTSEALYVSPDGSIIVGNSTIADGTSHTFIYKNSSFNNSNSNNNSLVDVNNTYDMLYYNGFQLNSLINLKTNLLNYSLNQDCNKFGSKNICIGGGVRYSYVNNKDANQQDSNLKIAYRFTPKLRAGLSFDQSFNNNDPSNFLVSNRMPLVTFFSNLSQNNNGTGFNLRLAGSYNDARTSITRSSSLSNTEAGRGTTNLVGKSVLAQISYVKNISKKWQVAPYLGIRKTEITRAGYTEDAGASFPIVYENVSQKITTALIGIKTNLAISKKLRLDLGAGLEHNIRQEINGYSGQITNISSFDINGPKMLHNRIFETIGASYDLKKNQTVSVGIYHSKQSLNNANAGIIYANYIIGF